MFGQFWMDEHVFCYIFIYGSAQDNRQSRLIHKTANIIGKMLALIRDLLLVHCLPGTM